MVVAGPSAGVAAAAAAALAELAAVVVVVAVVVVAVMAAAALRLALDYKEYASASVEQNRGTRMWKINLHSLDILYRQNDGSCKAW